MEHARSFELAARAVYLDLAAHADACPAFYHTLVCHGERSAVQAARIGQQLAATLGEANSDADGAWLPNRDAALSASHRPEDALDLADQEIAMYRDLLRLASQAGQPNLAKLCEDLLEEETRFRATVATILERGRAPLGRPVPRPASDIAALFTAPVTAPGDEIELCMGAA